MIREDGMCVVCVSVFVCIHFFLHSVFPAFYSFLCVPTIIVSAPTEYLVFPFVTTFAVPGDFCDLSKR